MAGQELEVTLVTGEDGRRRLGCRDDEMGIDDPFALTGVYQGVDLAHQSVLDPATLPAEILLFRRPILDEWVENGEASLGELIAHVLIHEIGHHFGLSDADIHAAEG